MFVDAPLAIVEQRDVKGLYKRARAGEIPNFTGITSPYEAPLSPDLHLRTDLISVEKASRELITMIEQAVELQRSTAGGEGTESQREGRDL